MSRVEGIEVESRSHNEKLENEINVLEQKTVAVQPRRSEINIRIARTKKQTKHNIIPNRNIKIKIKTLFLQILKRQPFHSEIYSVSIASRIRN